MTNLANYLNPQTVIFLDVDSREEAIKAIIQSIDKTGKIEDPTAFYQAIVEREKIISTGIGMGTAIPHAKTSICKEFFIAIGILNRGIEWDSLDGIPVRIIFMIGGPDNKQTQYLQILSALTHLIKDENIRKKMLSLKSADEIIALFAA